MPHPRDSRWIKQKLLQVEARLEKAFGAPRWPGPREPLDVMVEGILSQSTSDTNRERAFAGLRARFPTWHAVAQADPAGIADAIRCGGLANQKSVRIRDFVRWVKAQFGGYSINSICTMPLADAYAVFCGVHGIGVKTVAVTMLFACGRDVFPVDTHIKRICRRIGFAPANAPAEKIHRLLEPHVPPARGFGLHVNLIRLGRQICRTAPKCGKCPLRQICEYGRRSPSA